MMGRKRMCVFKTCSVCLCEFQQKRQEQVYCGKVCTGKARSARAAIYHSTKTEKRCYSCKKILPLLRFSRCKVRIDGYAQSCKECREEERNVRLKRVKQDAARLALYRSSIKRATVNLSAKVHAQRSNATIDEWLHHFRCGGRTIVGLDPKERRMRSNQRATERYHSDDAYRDLVKEKQRLRHIERPWVMLARKHRRDAKIAGVMSDGSVTAQALKDMWISTEECLYCGIKLSRWNKSVEHMHPMSRGGYHAVGNVVIVCSACNERKRQRWFDEWIELINEPHRSHAHDVFVRQFYGS